MSIIEQLDRALSNKGMYTTFDYTGPLSNIFSEISRGDSLGPSTTYSSGKNSFIMIAVPGFKKDEISISVEGLVLTVSAKAKDDRKMLINSGSTSFNLSKNTDVSNIVADLADGVLTITLSALEKPKNKIEINVK